MNQIIPLLGGVPFYGGEGAFWFFLVTGENDTEKYKR
jgi:hypothetical protein